MVDPHKIFLSALLFTTFNDVISGFSLDITSPILNKIIPGDVSKPVTFRGVQLYITRFVIRLTNVLVALFVVNRLTKVSKTNQMIPRL